MLDNIPIYRAKKKDSDEYVEGYYHSYKDNIITEDKVLHRIVQKDNPLYRFYDIDTTTLSIHFPNMLASDSDRYFSNGEKDLRIFASLQKDGKGGDICESKWFNIDAGLTVKTESVRYSNNTMLQDGYNISRYEYKKIIGVQE